MEFTSEVQAINAFNRLSRLEIKGIRLKVQAERGSIRNFTIKNQEILMPESTKYLEGDGDGETSRNAFLSWHYPPANEATVAKIAEAILAVPKLYTQVLNLMNKMDLPPPFVDPLPPAINSNPSTVSNARTIKKKRSEPDSRVGTDESECESEPEVSSIKPNRIKEVPLSKRNQKRRIYYQSFAEKAKKL